MTAVDLTCRGTVCGCNHMTTPAPSSALQPSSPVASPGRDELCRDDVDGIFKPVLLVLFGAPPLVALEGLENPTAGKDLRTYSGSGAWVDVFGDWFECLPAFGCLPAQIVNSELQCGEKARGPDASRASEDRRSSLL